MSDCVFCKILAGEIPSMKVYEDEYCIATLDIGPATDGHTLILAKEHYQDVTEVPDELLGHLFAAAKKVGQMQKEKLGAAGFNIVQNNGEAANQTVRHFHIHVIPRYEGGPVIAAWTPAEPDFEKLGKIQQKLLK